MADANRSHEGAREDAGLRARLPERLPPSLLEQRITRSLAAAGVLRPRDQRIRTLARLGAVAALVVLGVAVGRISLTRTTNRQAEPRFVLLLYRSPIHASEPANQAALSAAEHRAWARRVAAQGHEIWGEELSVATTVLNGSAGIAKADPLLEGFFIISAAGAGEAADIARSCPHAVRGGLVVVRSITPT